MFKNKDMSVFDWLIYYVLMAIPLINIIVFLVILFSNNSTPSLRNFLLFQLLMGFIIGVIIIMFYAQLISLLGEINYYL